MKKNVVILSILFFCSMGTYSFAQIGGFVKNRAASATNRAQQQTGKEIDKKVNTKIDEGISNLFNKNKGDKDQPATNQSEPAVNEQSAEPVNSSSSGSNSGSRSGSNAAANDMMGRAILGSMGISTDRPANIKNSYDYSGNIKMVVQEWDDSGETDGEVLYTTHYTNDNKGYAMDFKSTDKGNSRIIFDNDNHVMIMMGDDGKEFISNYFCERCTHRIKFC